MGVAITNSGNGNARPSLVASSAYQYCCLTVSLMYISHQRLLTLSPFSSKYQEELEPDYPFIMSVHELQIGGRTLKTHPGYPHFQIPFRCLTFQSMVPNGKILVKLFELNIFSNILMWDAEDATHRRL